jgi:hypothetical protein
MARKKSLNRIEREQRTFELMLRIYCRAHHGTGQQLCAECHQLLLNASIRLGKCPFGNTKPACGKCPHNCHAPTERTKIRKVMSFAGPRMLWRHPWLAMRHLWDSRRSPHDNGKQSPSA